MNTIAYLEKTISFLEKYGKTRKEKADVEILKQCLEERQALEIIVKKGVDKKNLLESNNFREYNKNLLDTYRGTTYFKNEHNLKYTEEEYDLVRKVVKEIMENV